MDRFEDLLANIRVARGTGNFDAAEQLMVEFRRNLRLQESKLCYEEAMAAFLLSKAATEDDLPRLLNKAHICACRSAWHALQADDKVGVLYAEMIRGGHILPAQGDLKLAVYLLRSALLQATAIEVFADTQMRVCNLVMNLQLHLIDHAIDADATSPEEVRLWVDALKGNPVFQEKETYFTRWMEKAAAYVA